MDHSQLMKLSEPMRNILSETVVKEHTEDYTIVSVRLDEESKARSLLRELRPFSSVTYDNNEVSVVLRSSDWERLRGEFHGSAEAGPYRLLTFDIVLDLSIVGFLSVVSALLAEEGVSIFAISTYLRDHILVRKEDSPRAVAALRGLVEECRRPRA
jgi:hypothetical protein